MDGFLSLAATNLVSPIVLSFALGLGAALLRSDLSIPEAMAKAMSLYLLFSIGFKGGAGVAGHGVEVQLLLAILSGVLLSLLLPLLAFSLLRVMTRMAPVDAAAVAGHYGSISIVTFVAATSVLGDLGIVAEGYMVAVAAVMEAPAILTALWLAARTGTHPDLPAGNGLWREILLNGSIVLLLGAFAIGLATGSEGMAEIEGFIVTPFKGVLCLFLLDMGLVAGRGLRGAPGVLSLSAVAFGVLMPLAGSLAGLLAALVVGLSAGGTMLMMVLAASASYIAVPAAMRVALPQANPAIYLTLSLGVTFPFNLVLGIPLYLAVASLATGG